MKKKKINKLSLNKSAISSLDELSGGLASPVPVATNLASGCPGCTPLTNNNCPTDNHLCRSSVVAWCNVSCWVC